MTEQTLYEQKLDLMYNEVVRQMLYDMILLIDKDEILQEEPMNLIKYLEQRYKRKVETLKNQ